MKRILAVLLLFSIFLQFSVTAGALVFPDTGDSGADDAPVILCDVAVSEDKAFYPYTKKIIILDENDVLSAEQLPYMNYLDTNGNNHSVPVNWNITDEALMSPGLHTVYGTPISDEKYSLAEGFDGIVTWPVFRKGGDAVIEATPIQNHLVSDPLIFLNSADPASEISISTKNRRCAIGEDGYILSGTDWVWSWDCSMINTTKAGSALVTGTLTELPSYITIHEEYKTVTHTVYVMPTDRIEIYAPTETTRSGELIFEWIYDSKNVSNAVLEFLDENNSWTSCDKSWYTFRFPTSYSSAKLYLKLLDIPCNADYKFRLSYSDIVSGEAVQRFTEPVSITIPENIPELIANANGAVPDSLDIGGDRDGGDSSGNELPDYTQSSPQPETNANQNEEPVSQPVNEVVTYTYSAISGLRLKELINSGDTVLFEKHGVSVEIPSGLLKKLNIGDNELFEITILNPQKNTVQIEIIASGSPVKDIHGTIVYLPWDADSSTDLECHDINGDFITKPVYDTINKTASFKISSTGTYFITATHSEPVPEEPNEQVITEPDITPEPDTEKDNTPLYIGIGIGIFIILSLAVFLIWRRLGHD